MVQCRSKKGWMIMYQFFVRPENISGDRIIIDGEDVNHIKNVLRMKTGDEISVSNGTDGREYRCGIEEIGDTIVCRLRFIKEADSELPVKIYLFQGLAKGDKMETIVQKAVELGAYEIVPVAMKRSVVRYDEKKAAAKVNRLRIIAEAAAKQSKRAIVPDVHEVLDVAGAIEYAGRLDAVVVPYELEGVNLSGEEGARQTTSAFDNTRQIMESIRGLDSVGIFIGPEGGFEPSEIDLLRAAKAKTVTLGKRILRTETAGMTVLSWLIYLLES